ncbi:MAG: type IV toxin-antitoxin system AbiEi family antitoxin domain-containing protein [Bifidobacteriaceae bacterium]|nr:type IV toxin-antitoxin system AbiEi family antitoxin domain-containing protein [Bifidobacteriaceae bacterium]
MKHALLKLSELAASQWGMVTTAQANQCGVTRLQLSRLAQDGQLERLSHGVYRDAAVPLDRFAAIRAAWLSINPSLTAEQRISRTPFDAVAAGATASHLLGLGDLVPEPYLFAVPQRRQTQRPEIRFRLATLPAASVTISQGLPTTTPEQTIADLIREHTDLSSVAQILAGAPSIDLTRTADLLAPLAARNGFHKNDGDALLANIQQIAHLDARSLIDQFKNGPLYDQFIRETISEMSLTAPADSPQ